MTSDNFWFFIDDGSLEVDFKSLVQVLSSSGPNTRLPKQPDLSSDMYNLMMKCWQSDPEKRPSFEVITNELKSMWWMDFTDS